MIVDQGISNSSSKGTGGGTSFVLFTECVCLNFWTIITTTTTAAVMYGMMIHMIRLHVVLSFNLIVLGVSKEQKKRQ